MHIFLSGSSENYVYYFISPTFGRMSKPNNRDCLKTDDFFNTNGKVTEKNDKGVLPTVFLCHFNTGKNYSNFIMTGNFSTKNTFCKTTNTNAYNLRS